MCTTLTLGGRERTEEENNIFSEEEKNFWDVQIIIILHLRKEGGGGGVGVLHLCNITLLLGTFEIKKTVNSK